jgi:hypothetical protein
MGDRRGKMTNTLRLGWLMVGLSLIATSCFQASGESDNDDDEGNGTGGSGLTTGSGGSSGTSGGTTGGTEPGSGGSGGATGGTTGATGGTTGATGGTTGATGGTTGATGGTTGATGGAPPTTGGTAGTTGGTTGATGGSSGAGGSVAGTGGGSGAPGCGSTWSVDAGGYVTSPGSSCFQGHAWTSASGTYSSILPADFSACGSPCSLCASGVVGAEIDFSGVGILAMNLNQAPGDTALGTVIPTGGAVTVSFTNNGGSPLRVQIQGPNGDTSEYDRWCYELTGASGTVTIPYSSFNTQCWTNAGYYYAGEPLEALLLLVPGSDIYDVPFDVCLTGASDGGAALER